MRIFALFTIICGMLNSPTKALLVFAVIGIWSILTKRDDNKKFFPLLATIVASPIIFADSIMTLTVFASWIFWSKEEEPRSGVLWGTPWLALIGLWAILTGYHSFSYGLVYDLHGTFGERLSRAMPDFYGALEEFLRTGALISGISLAAQRSRAIIKGAPLAALVISVVLFIQLTGSLSGLTNPYWISLNRFPSTFSDPNAFGIGALLITILSAALITFECKDYARTKKTFPLIIIGSVVGMLTIASLYSGSRSYILGIALLLITLFISFKEHIKRKVVLPVAIVLVASFIIVLILPKQYLPSAVNRARSLCMMGQTNDQCWSRLEFSTLALHQFKESPEIGHGPGSFEREVTHHSQILNSSIGGWVDSGNNFFFQMLAEYGLLGLVAVILAVSRLGRKKSDNDEASERVLVCGLCVLFVLLWFGSHFDFAEVAILSGILIGAVLIPKPLGLEPRTIPLIVLAIPLIYVASLHMSYGLYPYERENDGSWQRWLAPKAKFTVKCVKGNVLAPAVYLRNTFSEPQKIKIHDLGRDENSEIVIGGQQKMLVAQDLKCKNPREGKTIEVETVNGWSPANVIDGSNDTRLFGLRLEGDPRAIE